MRQYSKGEIVKCPACGELPDGCEYVAEDYFPHPIRPNASEQFECGNCDAIIDCKVSACGNNFLFSEGEL